MTQHITQLMIDRAKELLDPYELEINAGAGDSVANISEDRRPGFSYFSEEIQDDQRGGWRVTSNPDLHFKNWEDAVKALIEQAGEEESK
jgi:hypothetical protein